MATIKKEIFLASRFEEFKEIRRKLAEKIEAYNFMEAIDLNDNQAFSSFTTGRITISCT